MLGSILGALGGLAGSIFSSSNASKEAAANRESQERMAAQNIALQKEFAQSGIRWKVEDAKQAGIHPLYALGASTTSFSPVSIGNVTSDQPDWGKTLSSMGQDIGGAIERTRTQSERVAAMATTMGRLQIEGAQLDNDIKRAAVASSIQRLRANANPPMAGVPTPPGLGSDDPAPFHPQDTKIEALPRMSMGGGKEIALNPRWSNTDTATKRWGESADWWYGPLVMYNDYMANNPNFWEQFNYLERLKKVDAAINGYFGGYGPDDPRLYGTTRGSRRWYSFRRPHGRLGPDRR